MDKYLPILIVGAIIGIFTIAFVIAYIRMKKDKSYKEFERNMSDSQLIKRLLGYGRPYIGQFILVFVIMIQHSPSGKYLTRALVPANVPVLLQPFQGVESFHPSANVSLSKYSVICATLSGEIMSLTSGLPSMDATNLASSAVEPHHAPAPESIGRLLPP